MKAKLIKLELHDGYRLDDENGLFIASTLDSCKNKLSLKNCEAIERGYDLDELAKTIFPDKIFTTDEEHEIPIDGFPYQWGFKVGFQKALELMSDKKFSEKDVKNLIDNFHSIYENGLGVATDDKKQRAYKLIQSLQQTEWDVEIEMEKVEPYKDKMGNVRTEKTFPKLDADGCLILKLAKP